MTTWYLVSEPGGYLVATLEADERPWPRAFGGPVYVYHDTGNHNRMRRSFRYEDGDHDVLDEEEMREMGFWPPRPLVRDEEGMIVNNG